MAAGKQQNVLQIIFAETEVRIVNMLSIRGGSATSYLSFG